MPVAWDEFEPVAAAEQDTKSGVNWGEFEPAEPVPSFKESPADKPAQRLSASELLEIPENWALQKLTDAGPPAGYALNPRLGTRFSMPGQPVKGYVPGKAVGPDESIIPVGPKDVPPGVNLDTMAMSSGAKVALGLAQGMTTRKGLSEGLLAATPLAPVVATKWAMGMVDQVLDSVPEAVEAYKKRDWQGVSDAIFKATGAIVGTGLIAAHAGGAPKAKAVPIEPTAHAVPPLLPTERIPDAREISPPTEVHGDVSIDTPSTRAIESAGESAKVGISSRFGGRRGQSVHLVSQARELSKAIREGSLVDLQQQLQGPGMGAKELSRLFVLVPEEGQPALEAIRQSSIRGATHRQAAEAANAISNYQKASGKSSAEISPNDVVRILGAPEGVFKGNPDLQRKFSEPVTSNEPERSIEYASKKRKTTTLYESLSAQSESRVREVPVEESSPGIQPQAEEGPTRQTPSTVLLTPKSSEDFANMSPEEIGDWLKANKYGPNEDASAGITSQQITRDWTVKNDLPKLLDEIARIDDANKEISARIDESIKASKDESASAPERQKAMEAAMSELQRLQPLQTKRGRLKEFAQDIPGVAEHLKGIEKLPAAEQEGEILSRLRKLTEKAPEEPVTTPVTETATAPTEPQIQSWKQGQLTAVSLAKTPLAERQKMAQYFFGDKSKTGPKTLADAASKRFAEMAKPKPATPAAPGTEVAAEPSAPIASVHVAKPEPVRSAQAVGVSATTDFGNGTLNVGDIFLTAADKVRDFWRGFSNQELPLITKANRETGEAGVQYAAAPMVARAKGLEFAGKVLDDTTPDMDLKLGVALTEDNLRDIKRAPDDPPVATMIGVKNSPFNTEAEYQAFLADPQVQELIARHKALWESDKDPLYRQANNLDPDVPLETRGVQTGARINLKNVMAGEGTKTTVGTASKSPLIRQARTFLKRDPFARRATGTGQSYEGSYTELMANGFEREYPVAKQHEFIRKLIGSGDAVLSDTEFPSDLQVKGERPKAYLMKLKPWGGRWLQVRKSLAHEYEAVTGLSPAVRIPVYSAVGDFLTKNAIRGFAEGSTHIANIATQAFTGLGPTANPMINAMIKAAGRADVLWTLPKIVMEGFRKNQSRMLRLMEIGAAKEPFSRSLGMGSLINKVDQGMRLVAADTIRGMQKEGWVVDTETELRHFVNQIGQYNKKLQPRLIRALRDTGVQPFATAGHTFNVQALRTMTLSPGVKAPSMAAALALRAEKAAGWIGFIVLVGAINKLVSGRVSGSPGTKFGQVGWTGDDKKLHTFDVGGLTGYGRALRVTGVGPAIEAKRAGLPPNEVLNAGVRGPANAAVSYVSGPVNRTALIATTGKRPGIPAIQEAKIAPPTDEFAPLKSQAAKNIEMAAQEANPIIDSLVRARQLAQQGKSVKEVAEQVAQRQFSRYTPRTGPSQETVKALPRIVKARELKDYADATAKELRKLPRNQRVPAARKAIQELDPKDRGRVMERLQRAGVFTYQ